MMGLIQTIAPAAEPLSTSEAKAHIRLEISDDDTLVSSLITAARLHCEKFTRRAFVTQTWKLTLDEFPKSSCISIPLPPLQSVSSVTYYDSDGTQQTMSSGNYIVDANGEPGRVCLAPGATWPVVQSRINCVEVTFVAGYGDAADVPQDLKSAQLLLLGHLYENREAVILGTIATTLPLAVESILRQYDWGGYA